MTKAMLAATATMALLAGCSEAPKQEAPAGPITLQAGLWEIGTVIESARNLDKGKAALPIEVGTAETQKVCLAATDTAKPQPELFVPSLEKCSYSISYFSGGTMQAQMTCEKNGLKGPIGATVRGKYTATTIDAQQIVETRLYTDGDVSITSRLTGKRLGDCPAG